MKSQGSSGTLEDPGSQALMALVGLGPDGEEDEEDIRVTCMAQFLCPDGTTKTGCTAEQACRGEKKAQILKKFDQINLNILCTMDLRVAQVLSFQIS